jgi:dephospho-CoA kinase
MTHHQNLKIIALVGMTGSGKSTAVKHFTDKGIPKVYLGGFAYEIMEERGIEKGEDNEKQFRVAIREELGNDVYAQRAADQVHHLADAGQHRVIIDGIYSWDELKRLKHEFPGELTAVAIVAPRHQRYKWLEHRHEDRPQSHETSSERDRNEIENLNKGGPIAAADFYALNNGTPDNLFAQLDQIAREIEFF